MKWAMEYATNLFRGFHQRFGIDLSSPQVRVRELERTVTDSRAKEQRAREIGASLKCNYR